ncbi:MAG TPA: tetratricopeptide repeat protein [Steroidobacteraceae bacterium]|nr:tetratricopeptide repeat protein [Steroidobacteraceae bacterium]
MSLVLTTLLMAGPGFGAGGGSMPSGGGMSDLPARAPVSPEDQARDQYNAGVRLIEKADGLIADASHQADAKKQQKLRDKAANGYENALKKFGRATELQPSMYQAWNYLGYSHRKLGRYDAALAAYDRALALKPGYAEAIEYRGHAYLGLDRLSDAQQAYLTLFSSNRKLAAQLLAGMQEWVGAHRDDAQGLDVAAFATWVSERGVIAGQTASLGREGTSAAW